MDTTLLVMAAGMGSRFGGLKQIAPMGKNGEIILDFSVYDAIKAGFNKAVFIIKKDLPLSKSLNQFYIYFTSSTSVGTSFPRRCALRKALSASLSPSFAK